MAVTGDTIRGVAKGLFSATDATTQTRAEHVFVRRYIEADFTDGGTAATNYTESVIHTAQVSGRVLRARVTAPIAVTANGSTFVTFTLSVRLAADYTTALTVAAVDTSVSSMVAFTPVTMALTAANVVYTADSVLTVKAIKASTGVAFAAATSAARISVLIEENT